MSIANDFAAIAARMPGTAPAATSNDDAELIRLCDRLVAIEAERAAIFETVAEDEQDRALDAATGEYDQIEARLAELGNPTTLAGMRAMARAAVATAPKNTAGEVTAGVAGLSEWLAFGVVEAMAGSTGA